MSAGRLAGRVAFVTGGLRGIGHAAAARMLDDGATVIVSDLDSESDAHDLLGDLADRVGYVQANVTDEGDWARALDHVKQAHGACHILVNNAGIDLTGAVETLELEDWRRIMAINVDGVFMGTKRFVPLMAESGSAVQGGSSIVNVSSIMGLVGYAEVSAYNASKGAVRLFTKGIAIATAVLAASALFASYTQDAFEKFTEVASEADIAPFYEGFWVFDAKVLVGALLGAGVVFLFSGLAINAVGRAAGAVVYEVRRQFREIPGIMEGTGRPEYARAVDISTQFQSLS